MSKRPPTPPPLPETGFVRQSQLVPHILGVSSATFWRLIAAHKFPSPVHLAGRVTAWRVEEVREWIASRKFDAERFTASQPRKTRCPKGKKPATAPEQGLRAEFHSQACRHQRRSGRD
jgi:prophage regulatory protein